jgi:three-Cys-motif partner protein
MGKRPGYEWILGGQLPELGRHSAAKHEVFDRYIAAYIRTLTKNHRKRELNLTIVDGFCGGGRYSLDGQEVDGSPLRMLAAVERAQAEVSAARVMGFEIRTEFVFVDDNANHIEFLRDQLHQRGHGDRIGREIRIINSTFEEACPSIIEAIRRKGRSHRSLFFLDQYGWSDVTFATIRDIMGKLAWPEVILTFMLDNLVNLLSDRMSDFHALTAIDYGREDIKALMALKQQKGWKRIIQNTVYNHIQAHTGAAFYTPFFIHPEKSNRDYWLLHLSKHHQAREEMGKIHWRMENTFEHFGRTGFNALGFMSGVDVRQDMIDFGFNDNARTRSEAAVLDQLPRLIHANAAADAEPLTKQRIFISRCNDTPVIADIVDSQLAFLRDEKEILITAADGSVRRSVKQFAWDDRIELVREPGLFSILSRRAA